MNGQSTGEVESGKEGWWRGDEVDAPVELLHDRRANARSALVRCTNTHSPRDGYP